MSLSANLERHAAAAECYDDAGQRRHVFHGESVCRCGLWEAEDHRQNATAHWNNGVAVRHILDSDLVRGLAVSTPATTGERYLSGLASDTDAGRQHMTWCGTIERVAACRAGLLIMPLGALEPYDTACVWTATPKTLFAQLAAEFFPPPPDEPPVVGQNVRIHPTAHVVNAVIGNNVTIGAHCAIGGPGFGFVEHDGQRVRFPQRGRVLIGDDVEIGNNTCIDRGALGDTIIHRGAKIDNLVHVAHNCFVGEGALVVAGAVLCGGVTVGAHAWIGAGAMVREQLLVGSRALVGIGAVVVKNVANGATVMGNPARAR